MTDDTATSAVVDPVADPEVGASVPVAGVVTKYHDVGSGPPLLLLHGSGPGVTAWANWRGVIPDLTRQFRVIAPDLLGFGRTLPGHDTTYRLTT
jgi:2-hydroxymuconate-semialdehyde hydrolase